MTITEYQQAIDLGLLNEDKLLQAIKMKKEEAILAQHPHPITQLSNGRWQTFVYDETKANKRREVKLSTREKIVAALIKHYDTATDRNKLKLADIFEEWLEYKTTKKNNKPETKSQNRASYEKYVKGTKIDTIPLQKLTAIDLEEWAIEVLKKHPMTSQTFNTHKQTVTGPLTYAKRKKYIEMNPWVSGELEYQHLFKSKRIKPAAERIFYPDEIDELLQEFDRGYSLNGNIANLALKINFDLGLRVGELVALKWSDINWDNKTVFIQHMEESSGNVVEYVKSDSSAGYRELDLTEEIITILKHIKHSSKILSEYIFCNNLGERVTTIKVEHRLTKAQLALGWEKTKGTHCIRRTVASVLQTIPGISLDEIRRRLGHTDKQTTLGYIYNPYRQDKLADKIKENSILHLNQKCLQVSAKNAVGS